MTLDEIIKEAKDLNLEDMTLLRAELDDALKSKALAVLDAKENELNDIRALAGLKKKPLRKTKTVPGAKRGPKPGKKAEEKNPA